jgi:hypothetical protein
MHVVVAHKRNCKEMFNVGTSYTANRYECVKGSLRGLQHFNVLCGKTSYVGMCVLEVVSQYFIATCYAFQTLPTVCTGGAEANSW